MKDIIGYGGAKGGDQHVHYEATDSLHSISYARVVDLLSEGEVLGLAKGLESVYLDGTPVQNPDGSLNFQNISMDFRPGTQDQDYIPGFPSVENEIAVGVELKSGSPWVHSITNVQLDAVRIMLAVPALSKADTENGDIYGYKIDYQIELATDGGAYAVVLSSSFDGKTTTQYQRSARIDLPAATSGWLVRVTRLTDNANTAAIADVTTVVSYTEVIDAKLRYPMSALVGIQVDAKQFQTVPTRAYDLYGRIVQVPANYDPQARTYATTGTGTSNGAWDGTFKPAWTSNPAWIFRDLALNDRYGLGQRISAAQVDKWALYKIARYCDELVPNGKGGTEPRFTCNVYLQAQKQAYTVLQDLATVFRGIVYWSSGSILACADMPSDPVYVYTAANVINGKFARVGSSKKTRSTVALVSWNDMSDMGRAKVEYVEDPEGIKRYGIQQVSLTAFGCTSQGQAQRVGRWALATARLETGAISFDVGLDGAIALPGQIVRIADPARLGRRNGGRIHAAAGRVVTLDKAPVINAGDALTVILPTGVSETHGVVAVSGNDVTVDADWSSLPNAESVWSVDNADLVAPLYRILSVAEKDGLAYTITATQHEPGKFDYIENGTAIASYPQTSIDVSKQAAPSSVTVSAFTVSLQDVQKLAMSVSCAAVAGAVAYEGAYRRDNGNWIPIPRQLSPSFDIVDVLPGTYVAKLAAVNSIGVASVETLSDPTVVSKNANPKNAGILLTPSAPAFHVATDGSTSPAAITFTASLLDLEGAVGFSAVGGTLTNVTATTADLAYADMPGTSATVTASITVNGQPFTAQCTVGKVQDGAAGSNGLNTALVYAYQRSASAPSGTPGDVTYDFSTKQISTAALANGWQKTMPAANGNPVYVTVATASASGSTDTIASAEWSGAVVLAQDGTPGAAGLNVATVRLYQRTATNSAPALPSAAVTYTFSSGALAGLTNGWSATVPASGGAYLFTTQATASANTATDSIATSEWAGATLSAQDGASGSNGQSVHIGLVYQQAASQPAAPAGGTFNFSSATLTPPDGWSATQPASSTTPTWVAAFSFSTAMPGATVTAGTWAAPVAVAQNGSNGANGLNSATVTIYQRAATNSAPALPSAATTYTFSSGALSGLNNGWSATIPASGGGYLFASTATAAATTATDTIAATEWAAPNLVAQDGQVGTRGAGHWYASGSAWSDTTADAACPGGKVTNDVVTISSGSFVMTKKWSGSTWATLGTVVDGTLLVTESVATAALKANSVTTEKMLVSGSNLVPNSDFATGDLTNWRAFGLPANISVISAATAGVPTGAKSVNVCKMLNGAGTAVSMFTHSKAYADTGADKDGFAVNEGEQYNVRIDMAKDAGMSGTGLVVWAYFYKADGTHTTSAAALDLLAGVGTTFQTFTGSFAVPAGALRCWLFVRFIGTAGSVYWSNLRAARMADDQLVVDGGIKARHLSVTSLDAVTTKTGDLEVTGSLRSGQTAYNTGTGYYIGGGAAPKMSMKTANGATFLLDPANNVLSFNGATISGASISGVTISDKFTIGTIGDISGSIAATGTTTTIGTVTLAQSGGKTPYQKPLWSTNYVNNGGVNILLSLDSTGTVATIKANSRTSGANSSMDITVTTLDANGLGATQKFNVYCDAT